MVDAVRSLLVGTTMGDAALWSIVWSVAILLVSMPLAAWLFKRKTAQ
jgi:ABC-2 type transport system permease protein